MTFNNNVIIIACFLHQYMNYNYIIILNMTLFHNLIHFHCAKIVIIINSLTFFISYNSQFLLSVVFIFAAHVNISEKKSF